MPAELDKRHRSAKWPQSPTVIRFLWLASNRRTGQETALGFVNHNTEERPAGRKSTVEPNLPSATDLVLRCYWPVLVVTLLVSVLVLRQKQFVLWPEVSVRKMRLTPVTIPASSRYCQKFCECHLLTFLSISCSRLPAYETKTRNYSRGFKILNIKI